MGGRRWRRRTVHLRPIQGAYRQIRQRPEETWSGEGRQGVPVHGAHPRALCGLLLHTQSGRHCRAPLLRLRAGPGEGPSAGQRGKGPDRHARPAGSCQRHSRRPARLETRDSRQQEQSLFGPPCPWRHQLRGGDGIGVVRLRHCVHHRRGLLHNALHVGHYRQAQGGRPRPHGRVAAHGHGEMGLGSPRRRHLLVHRRPRMGHRHILRHVRALDQRHHTGYLRGGLPRQRVVPGDSEVRRHGVVHRPNRHTNADEGGRRDPQAVRPLKPSLHVLRWRAPQPGGDYVGAEGARPALPRQLVADGDGGDSHRQLPFNGHQARFDGASHSRR